MSNLGISNNNQLSLPQTPLKPSKAVMPKETAPVKNAPSILTRKSLPTMTESQSVLSKVKEQSNQGINTTQKVLDTQVSLSDVSGELTTKAKLKNAFQGLKALFSPSANKIKYKVEPSTNEKVMSSGPQDLFLMKYNPLASSKDKTLSRDFDAFSYKEFSNENTEFLKFSRKLVSMGTDHPDFGKHLTTGVLHFVKENSERQINIAALDRKQVMKDFNAFKSNPSTENKAKLLTSYNTAIKKVYDVMGDTAHRFKVNGKDFRANVRETKQGRLWKNFKADHKKWWNNRRPWNSKQDVKADFSNFFKSWGSFSKATANIFFMQAMPESIERKSRTIGGQNVRVSGSSSTVVDDKLAYAKARAFNSGKTVPKYSDYNL